MDRRDSRSANILSSGAIIVALLSAVAVWFYAKTLCLADVQAFGAIATAVASVVGIVALLVLIIYTKETFLLRKTAERQTEIGLKQLAASLKQVEAAHRQNEMAIMPVVMFDFKPVKETSLTVLRNVGSGPAFNISVEDAAESSILTFNPPTNLGPGNETILDIIVDWETPDQYTITEEFRLKKLFGNERLPEKLPAKIIYDSAHGRHYQTLFRLEYNPDTDHMFIVFEKMMEVPAPSSSDNR